MKVPVVVYPQGKCAGNPRLPSVSPLPEAYSHTTHLAHRLQQNWLIQHPTDTCSNGGVSLDDSLTSLTWLQNLNIVKIASPTPPPSPPNAQFPDHHKCMKNSSSPNSKFCTNGSISFHPYHRITITDSPPLYGPLTGPDNIDYKTNSYVKPPYSYATLICMAMKQAKKNKLTLSAIYNWITDNFMYYRTADPTWQNSIRHNLSLNKCFEKVARQRNEPGKGGFWRINPNYSDMIENGIFKKRRACSDSHATHNKQLQDDNDELLIAANKIKGTREDKLLSNGLAQYGQQDDSGQSITLQNDFNWSAILNEDIDIGGIKVKTEHIDGDVFSPLTALSPPSSESTTSDDLSLDELFSTSNLSIDMPGESIVRNPLDLTVTGTSIRPPEWWSDNMLNIKTEKDTSYCNGGLHTPVLPTIRSEIDDIWSHSTNFQDQVTFDLDLFNIDTIPSPQIF